MSRNAGPPPQSGFMDEIRKIPPVTRTLVASTLAVSGPVMLQLVSPYPLLFVWKFVKHGQLWRIPTSFFFGGSGFAFLFDVVMLYRNSDALETIWFNKRSADYAWQLLMASGLILALNIPLESFVHYRGLLMCLTYLSSRLNPEAPMSIFGLLTAKALYFPFALVGMDVIMGGPAAAIVSFTGLVAGHVWYMLEWQEDASRGRSGGGRGSVVGRPPRWFERFIGNGSGSGPTGGGGSSSSSSSSSTARANPRPYGAAIPPRTNDAPRASTTGYTWGRGNRLGTE
ncbi:hypothetical protein FRB96_001924 [Tulasnella sp. 330]|nr:hypothetical protein FRB96_001924 [Tulasnella sp. 330]KAG8879960.1 hypothetical protein FRB97_001259 [Tulasnella sp. 331]KAG8886449.1 hypothetical protein FRB98_001268 [Tulasnella sp. 332]